jgi:hypothetical protein
MGLPQDKGNNCGNDTRAHNYQDEKVVPDIVIAQQRLIIIFCNILVPVHGDQTFDQFHPGLSSLDKSDDYDNIHQDDEENKNKHNCQRGRFGPRFFHETGVDREGDKVQDDGCEDKNNIRFCVLF